MTLTPAEVTSLPLDELALRVLAAAQGEWNWRNWMIGAQAKYGRQQEPALDALNEAWNWLFNHGLVSLDGAQHSEGAIKITRRGHETLRVGLPWLRAVERLDVELVPALERQARPQFIRGDFETAAFVAMKEVEVEVRKRGGFDHSAIGTTLMQEAFRPDGPLWRSDLDKGESVALMELFKGSIGTFKNPSSHRRVDYTDATEAAEVVLLADLLLRLLAKIA